MPARNSAQSYGSVARSLHWLTALLIFTAFPLGLIANRLPYDTSEALAEKAWLFSVHKTFGVVVFLVALARILWTLTQPHPAPLHPDRRLETFAAAAVHWLLYGSLLLVPLTGWVHHAALDGFAPILWPFGQNLPMVPKSETVAHLAGSAHWLFTKLLLLAVLLHISGALKHVFIDRDETLARMTRGAPAAKVATHRTGPAPFLTALAVYALAAFGAVQIAASTGISEPVAGTSAPAAATGNWQVQEGSLTFTVQQMGAEVQGSFATWSAEIDFDQSTGTGAVTVHIDTTSLTLGAVTDQARQPEFFDVAAHPAATFSAAIAPATQGFKATGALTLRGAEHPVTLPFTLEIQGDTATMTGSTTLDRRDYGMGPSYPDEVTVGFPVAVQVSLTAKKAP
jgi:cytochrome b561